MPINESPAVPINSYVCYTTERSINTRQESLHLSVLRLRMPWWLTEVSVAYADAQTQNHSSATRHVLAKEGDVIALVARHTKFGSITAEMFRAYTVRGNGPLRSVQVCLSDALRSHAKSPYTDVNTGDCYLNALSLRGDYLSVDELRELGYSVPMGHDTRYQRDEENELLYKDFIVVEEKEPVRTVSKVVASPRGGKVLTVRVPRRRFRMEKE